MELPSDEELASRIRERQSDAALAVLGDRHLLWMRQLVDRWGQRERLALHDREDLCQEAFLFLHKAAREYRTDNGGALRSRRFRNYLGLTISHWFRDAVRRLRRQERRFDGSVTAESILRPRASPPERSDPAEVAARREVWESLDAALFILDEPFRRLCNEVELGQSLHASAAVLGWSYDRTKRLWRRMRAQLRAWLKEEAD